RRLSCHLRNPAIQPLFLEGICPRIWFADSHNFASIAYIKNCGSLQTKSEGKFLLGKEVVSQDCVDGMKAVFPIYFFPFAISSPVVGNSDFVNPAARFGQLGRDFRLEPKAVLAKFETLEDVGAKRFV